MKALSAALQSHILSLLKAGHSAHEASSITGIHHTTISRLRRQHSPYLPKLSGGRPTKLSDRNVNHAIRLIGSGKADTAVDVTRALQDVINQPLSSQTTRRYLKEAGMKAVVKKKKPELWERVEAEWNKIEPKVCQDLIESMPRRVQAVIEAKGGYTKY
jgi:transposase